MTERKMVQVSEQTHRALRIAAALRGVSMTELADTAILTLLATREGADAEGKREVRRETMHDKGEAERRIEENVAWQMKEGEEAERIRREEAAAWAEHEREKKQDRQQG